MNYIDLSKLILSFISCSPKKLQKLAYYVYVWYIALLDSNPGNIKFEAWVHGPVSTEIYSKYKNYGWSEIPITNSDFSSNSMIYKITEKVIEVYGVKSADELEALTHLELPWRSARCGLKPYESSNNIISDSVIKEFYQHHELYNEFYSSIVS